MAEKNMDNLLKKLMQIAQQNPSGFTVYLKDLSPVKRGWSVALKETQNSFGIEGLKKTVAIATEKTGIVGGWQEDGKFWWDAVQIFEDEDEAARFGKENEQLAIYHIESNRIKWLY
jgi:hypothetical protein